LYRLRNQGCLGVDGRIVARIDRLAVARNVEELEIPQDGMEVVLR